MKKISVTKLSCLVTLCLSFGIKQATARVLSDPSADEMYFVYLAVSKTSPDFADFGKYFYSYERTDEFDQADALAKIQANLVAQQKSLADVTEVIIPVSAYFSEYDSTYDEFDFTSMSDSTTVSFEPFLNVVDVVHQVSVVVTFDNGSDFAYWPLAPNAAKAIFERNHESRNVTLMIDVLLTGGEQSADQTLNLDGQIKTIKILGDQQQPLGVLNPPAKP